jgi:hypothetical protein
MTFKVDLTGHPYEKYKISIGTGKTFRANTLEELFFALQHYYRKDSVIGPASLHNLGKCPKCPFCEE